jgi:protein O-mannosyl-transferase
LPPFDASLTNRPIVNATFALNFAISGLQPWSYHLLNLLIHIAASLTLFGIVRRTLLQEKISERLRSLATPLALACTLIWALHPLQTSAVTYMDQRCESLMGLFFLLTFYSAIRGWQTPTPRPWHLTAVLFFLLGVGSKEVIIAAPVILFIYEIIFVHKSFTDALRKSTLLYAGMAVGTAVLLYPVFFRDSVAVVLGKQPTTPLIYWFTQPEVIFHYLRLAFWPHPLIFDYGWPLADPAKAWPLLILISAPIGAALWLLYQRHPLALPAAGFFIILAPTSLMPLRDPAVEYRMYLPLAALTAMVVCCACLGVLKRASVPSGRDEAGAKALKKLCLVPLIVIVVALGVTTHERNRAFAGDLTIWADTIEKQPGNARAHLNLGVALDRSGRMEEAIGHYREAIRLKPRDSGAYANLGYAAFRMGNVAEAIGLYQEAISRDPLYGAPYSNLGIALWQSGQRKEALRAFETALRLNPDQPEVHSNLGNILNAEGRYDEAQIHLQEALRLRPDYVEAHANLGFSLEQTGRTDGAIWHYQEALRLNPSIRKLRDTLERLTKRPESRPSRD